MTCIYAVAAIIEADNKCTYHVDCHAYSMLSLVLSLFAIYMHSTCCGMHHEYRRAGLIRATCQGRSTYNGGCSIDSTADGVTERVHNKNIHEIVDSVDDAACRPSDACDVLVSVELCL